MKKLALLSLAAAALWFAIPKGQSAEDLDPLKVASDTHSLLFENQFVRVIRARVPPGKTEPKHRHPRSVTVYMADYSIASKVFPEGKETKSERKFGTVSFSEPTIHEIRNVGKTPSDSIRIEFKY